MKNALFIILALLVMLAPACNTQTGGNQNSTGNKNEQLDNSKQGMKTLVQAADQILIVYEITKDAKQNIAVNETCEKCMDGLLAVNIKAATPQVSWQATFTGFVKDDNATVSIKGFRLATAMNTPLDPFQPTGGGYYSSPFEFKFDGTNQPLALPSIPLGDKKGTYKYVVIISWGPSGDTKTITLDPRVVLSDGTRFRL